MKRYKLAAIILCVSILACDLPAFGAVSGKIVKELIEATLERRSSRDALLIFDENRSWLNQR